jgi:hypothetical protein
LFQVNSGDGVLEQLALRAFLERRQTLQRGFQALGELGLDAQQLCGGDAVTEQLADQRQVHRAAGIDGRHLVIRRIKAVFGRDGRAGGQMTRGVRDQPAEEEFGRAAHQRPRAPAQEFEVAGEGVVLPQVLAQPRRAHRPIGPARIAHFPANRVGETPQVGVVVGHPARQIV